MIPEGWKQHELGDLLEDIKGGGTPSKKNPDFWKGEIPWASVKDITAQHKDRTVDYISEAGLRESASHLIPAETVIIATRMAVGKTIRFRCDVAINQDLKALFPKENLSSEFLFFWLNAHESRLTALASGSTVQGVRLEPLRALEVSLPTLPEQKRIAEVLGGVDAAIETTKAVIAQTRKVKQGLLETLLTRGIGHTKFKDSPLGEIPESWAVQSIGRICTISKRKYDPKKTLQDARSVELEHIEQITGNLIGEASAQSLSSIKTMFNRGDILFGKLRPYLRKYHRAQFDGVCTTEIWVLKPSENVLGEYLYLIVQSDYFIKAANVSTGTKMPRAEWSLVRELDIVLPPLPEQKAIARIFESVDSQLTTETEKLTSLQQLKKGMMQDLLTGKVRVPVGNNGLQLVNDKTKTAVPTKAVQPAFKRAVLAAEITHQLYQNPKFGSVKQEKIIDLCERHLDLDAELDRTAYRQAAGPYDNKAKRSIESNFKSQKWFEVKRATGQGVKYLPLANCGQHKPYFDRYFGHISADIQSIINLLKDLDTERCEIVATLYAAWNDFLIKGETPDDDAIVNDVLNNWHDKKKQIPKDRWLKALPWMRQQNLVPRGCGRETKGTKS